MWGGARTLPRFLVSPANLRTPRLQAMCLASRNRQTAGCKVPSLTLHIYYNILLRRSQYPIFCFRGMGRNAFKVLLPSFILHIYYIIDFKECQDKSFEPDEESGHSLPHNFVPCPFLILHIYYTIDFKKSQYPIGLSRDQNGRTIFFYIYIPPLL